MADTLKEVKASQKLRKITGIIRKYNIKTREQIEATMEII